MDFTLPSLRSLRGQQPAQETKFFDHVTHKEITDPFGILTVGFIALLRFCIFWMGKCNKTDFSRMLKTGIQYLPEDSIQTSVQLYLASQLDSSLSPFEKEEKRACL